MPVEQTKTFSGHGLWSSCLIVLQKLDFVLCVTLFVLSVNVLDLQNEAGRINHVHVF